jgi:hypothetical protein
MQTKKKPKTKQTYQKSLSLYPMELEEAVRILLKAKPTPKEKKK